MLFVAKVLIYFEKTMPMVLFSWLFATFAVCAVMGLFIAALGYYGQKYGGNDVIYKEHGV